MSLTDRWLPKQVPMITTGGTASPSESREAALLAEIETLKAHQRHLEWCIMCQRNELGRKADGATHSHGDKPSSTKGGG